MSTFPSGSVRLESYREAAEGLCHGMYCVSTANDLLASCVGTTQCVRQEERIVTSEQVMVGKHTLDLLPSGTSNGIKSVKSSSEADGDFSFANPEYNNHLADQAVRARVGGRCSALCDRP